jgi:hypothetical protein
MQLIFSAINGYSSIKTRGLLYFSVNYFLGSVLSLSFKRMPPVVRMAPKPPENSSGLKWGRVRAVKTMWERKGRLGR